MCPWPHSRTPSAGTGATPSEEGVYTFRKVVYEPGKKGNTKKAEGSVHYRLVEESDVEAIKEAFPHLVSA